MNEHDWAVVGAGPAGIATVGQLLDSGETDILWVDPHWNVGDFGGLWGSVPSNTKVKLFIKFLQSCKSFDFDSSAFELGKLPLNDTCLLKSMAEPLAWVTKNLRSKVASLTDYVESIDEGWVLNLAFNKSVTAKNVVMATGGCAKCLPYDTEMVPLESAITDRYVDNFTKSDVVAVFGSSHSAVLAIKNLLSLPVKEVVNFYKSPFKFAVHFEDHILFDDSGLKGETAVWAKENLVGKTLPGLSRVYSEKRNIDENLGRCNKAVYAVGFDPKLIHLNAYPEYGYDAKTGIIAPGVFGCGLAFPEEHTGRYGHVEHRVGLWKFMDYLKRVVPIWIKYKR